MYDGGCGSVAASLILLLLIIVVIAVFVVAVRTASRRTTVNTEEFATVNPTHRVDSLARLCELLSLKKTGGGGRYMYPVPSTVTVGRNLRLEGLTSSDVRRVEGGLVVPDTNSARRLFSREKNMKPAILIVNGDMHVKRGAVLGPSVAKTFTLLYVNGNLRVDGQITSAGERVPPAVPLEHAASGMSLHLTADGRLRMGSKKASDKKVFVVPRNFDRKAYSGDDAYPSPKLVGEFEIADRPHHFLDVRNGDLVMTEKSTDGEPLRWLMVPSQEGSYNLSLGKLQNVRSTVDFLDYDKKRDALKVRRVTGYDGSRPVPMNWKSRALFDPEAAAASDIVVASDEMSTSLTRPVVKSNGGRFVVTTSAAPSDGRRGNSATGLQTGGGGSAAAPTDNATHTTNATKSRGKSGDAFAGGDGGVMSTNATDAEAARGGSTLIVVCTGRVEGSGRLKARGEDAKSVGGGGGGGGCVVLLCRNASILSDFLDVRGGSAKAMRTPHGLVGGDGGNGSSIVFEGYGRGWHNGADAARVVGETGRVTLKNTLRKGVVAHVAFRNRYVDPVVLTYIPTRRGGQAYEARVRNVTPIGCELFGHEPPRYDHWHAVEEVCYVVLEKGVHRLEGGGFVEAGSLRTSSAGRGGGGGVDVAFRHAFKTEPAVLHSLNSFRNRDFLSTQAKNVSKTGFRVQQQVAETGVNTKEETIAWAAFQTGAFDSFEASRAYSGHSVGQYNKPYIINFAKARSYTSPPDVIVKGNSARGADGYWSRGSGQWTEQKHGVYAEEDHTRDRDRYHTQEWFAWVAASRNTDFKTAKDSG